MKYFLPMTSRVALFWILSSACALAADCRIMTWDLEDAYPLEKAATIARVIKKHHADIVALQSVQTHGTKFHDAIQEELDKLFGRDVYQHVATRGSRFDGNAVFWNTRTVQVNGSSVENSLQSVCPHQTPMELLHVKAGTFEFQFINVCLDQDEDENDDTEVKQASLLRRFIKKIQGTEASPVIVAGNFDMGFPDERVYDQVMDDYDDESNPAYHKLNSDNFLKFCTRDIVKKHPRAFSYIGDILEGGRLTDHIAANDAAWKQYKNGSAEVIRVDKEFYSGLEDYEWNFSDHLPVAADFQRSQR